MNGISHRQIATERVREHLDTIDWSGQTAGRQKILDAFLALAIKTGVSNVSMRMLAKEINVKAPTLYGHFPGGRDEVVGECLRWNYYRFGIAILEAVENTDSPKEFLEAIIRVHITRQATMPACDLWDIVIATDRYAHILQDGVRSDVNDWLAGYLQMYDAVALDLGYHSAKSAVRILMTVLDGVTSWFEWSGDEMALKGAVAQAITVAQSLLETSKPDAVGATTVLQFSD